MLARIGGGEARGGARRAGSKRVRSSPRSRRRHRTRHFRAATPTIGGDISPVAEILGLKPATKMQQPPEPLVIQGLPAACQLPRQDSMGAHPSPRRKDSLHPNFAPLSRIRIPGPPIHEASPVAGSPPRGKRLPPGRRAEAVAGETCTPCSRAPVGATTKCSLTCFATSVSPSSARCLVVCAAGGRNRGLRMWSRSALWMRYADSGAVALPRRPSSERGPGRSLVGGWPILCDGRSPGSARPYLSPPSEAMPRPPPRIPHRTVSPSWPLWLMRCPSYRLCNRACCGCGSRPTRHGRRSVRTLVSERRRRNAGTSA